MIDATDAIRAFLTSGQAGSHLVTVQRGGFPYLVQITAVVDDDLSVRIRTNGAALKAQQVRDNGAVGVFFVERAAQGPQKNVLLQGTATVTNDPTTGDAYFDDIASRYGITIDRTAPHMRNSHIIRVTPRFLRAEGFDPARFNIVTTMTL